MNPETPAAPHGHLRAYLLTGIVVAAPLVLTGFLFISAIRLVDGMVRPLFPQQFLPYAIPGVGVLLVLACLVLLGAFTVHFGGRWLWAQAEKGLARLPLIGTIYKPIRQVFESVASPTARSFREVALIEYPRAGCHALAFVTGPAQQEVTTALGAERLMLFVPTTPNLYSGFLIYLPREAVTIIDMPVDEAIRTLVSAGTASQPDRSSSAAASRSNR